MVGIVGEGSAVMASVSTISGLSSGIDWQSTIDALMRLEQRRVTLIENRQSLEQKRLDAWRAINNRMLALNTSMGSLQEAAAFLSSRALSSQPNSVAVTATGSAAPGVYRVQVEQLAAAARLVHQGVASADDSSLNTSGADQVFAYTYGSGDEAVTVTLAIPDGATLRDLRDLINQDAANPGVRASLLNDGSGGANGWHLVLSGTATGLAAQLAVDEELTTLGGGSFGAAAFTVTQEARNALYRVDGYPPEGWLESSGNTLTDTIEGLSLTLAASTAGEELTITVERDDAAIKAKIQSFVSAYNDLVGLINSTTTYNSEESTMGVLLGDSGVNQLKRTISQLVTRPFAGLDADARYTLLGQVGIKSGAGGLLGMDETKLEAALAGHPEDLAALFTFNARSDSPVFRFFTRQADTPAGAVSLSAEYDAEGALVGATLNGQTARVDGRLISGPENGPWAGLRILFRDPGDGPGTRSGTITLIHGAAAALTRSLTALTDSERGLVSFQTSRLEKSISRLADSIEDMNARLEAKRAQLTREYLAMESAMSRLQSQSSALSSLTTSSS